MLDDPFAKLYYKEIYPSSFPSGKLPVELMWQELNSQYFYDSHKVERYLVLDTLFWYFCDNCRKVEMVSIS